MKTRDFNYFLPEELIAQTPAEPRDTSRMLVCNREDSRREGFVFRDFPSFFKPEDVLVINHTRVIPARLLGVKSGTGAAVEILLLRRIASDSWEALVKPGRRLPKGTEVLFGEGKLKAIIGERLGGGTCQVQFFYEGLFENILDDFGEMPLPPYIHEKLQDPERYQTVYAKLDGSAAAPTAGLHFTPDVLYRIKSIGVDIVPILLHVGLGTFRPVKEEDVDAHEMHSEYYEVDEDAARRINLARRNGGRIVCVGTTSVRTLETLCDEAGIIHAGNGMTNIFIKPGVALKGTDVLLTNFHLPQSTLLMLVSAFMGQDNALSAYRQAVEEKYRFFSFGDCMLIGSKLLV